MRLFERFQFVEEHHWTYKQYDEAAAGDLLLHEQFKTLVSNLRNGK